MKKISLFVFFGVLVFTSCNKMDIDTDYTASTKENAEKVIGHIDPNQDWSSVISSNISVTADAPLKNIERIQILTESPIFNKNAKVLAETKVAKGQTVSLSFDAPNSATRLMAACIDSEGHYFIKGFDINKSSLNFSGNTTRSARRAGDYPGTQFLKLETANIQPSYNALRTRFTNEATATGNIFMSKVMNQGNISIWANAGWEKEMLWKPTDNKNTGTSWTIVNQTIVRNADNMSAEEVELLTDLFGDFLKRKIGSQRVDNREFIRNSNIVKMYNNHLTSDGSTPITVSPIFTPSTEISDCHLYYYYYDTKNIPSGMSEADYIKTLPKFKAIELRHTKNEATRQGYGIEDLYRVHEYLLPYYGENAALMPDITHATSFGTFSTQLYRIRNGRQLDNKDYYMVNTGNNDIKLATKYADDNMGLNNQLWQIFTSADGYQALYNVGTKSFLVWEGEWATTYTTNLDKIKACYYRFENIGDDTYHIFRYNSNKMGLGTDLAVKANNKRIATNKEISAGKNFEWILEKYDANDYSMPAVSDIEFETFQTTSFTSPSLAIPKGYLIGFMLRKQKNVGPFVDGFRDMTDAGHGCCYSFGTLNHEINNLPGHFGSSTSIYTMEEDDPRTCYIAANGKTYIGFEDGSDCQYNDLILEVGGYDQEVLDRTPIGTENKGCGIQTSIVYDFTEKEGYAYTLCFEDRPATADYDMNDVVIRCKRKTGKYSDYVDLSLVASGGDDDVWIRGISSDLAEFYDGIDLQKREVHELFMIDTEDGSHRFINTQKSSRGFEAPRIGVYKLKAGVTIPQFLSQIYIENRTTGQSVSVAKTGESPCGIIIPGNFDYPMEGQRITNVYDLFESWAGNSTDEEFKQWYNSNDETKTIKMDDVLIGR